MGWGGMRRQSRCTSGVWRSSRKTHASTPLAASKQPPGWWRRRSSRTLQPYVAIVVFDDADKHRGNLEPRTHAAHLFLVLPQCYMRSEPPQLDKALHHASRARGLAPGWPKPYHRLVNIHLMRRDTRAGLEAARAGHAVSIKNYRGLSEFSSRIDELAIEHVLGGSDVDVAGQFEGRRLEVRSAGEDEWLGKPAAYVPALDGVLDETTALASDDLSGVLTGGAAGGLDRLALDSNQACVAEASTAGDALASWTYSGESQLVRRQRTSFRCVSEALKAAVDGDRIVLLRGTHNGLGETIVVGKRVLIEGEGRLGETVIDMRANVPTFKVTRGGVVIRNVTVDHTGFREAVLVDGGKEVRPLFEMVDVKCSGDDGVHVGGSARPVLRRCRVKAKKVGVKCFDSGTVTLDRCIVEDCGGVGVMAMDAGRVNGSRTAVSGGAEDGVVVMNAGRCSLVQCTVSDNKGAGMDCSDTGYGMMSGCTVEGNVGGVFAWDGSSLLATGSRLDGGAAHVVLVDGSASVDIRGCTVKGGVHAPEDKWGGLLEGGNVFESPEGAVDFPIESGPFQFVPSPYTSL